MNSELRHLLKFRRSKAESIVKVGLPAGVKNRREQPGDDSADARHDIEVAMAGLDARERFVLTERIVNRSKLHEVGDAIGVTREWVRQIELAALRKCREALEAA